MAGTILSTFTITQIFNNRTNQNPITYHEAKIKEAITGREITMKFGYDDLANDKSFKANGKFLDADNMIKRRFNKVLDGAGVARVRFHDLRHTYASLLLAKDMNIKYIQKQMGHASFEITMNTYAHLMPEVYEKSEKAINDLL